MAELHGREAGAVTQALLLLIHDVLVVVCWELLRSGSRKIDKETEVDE